MAYRWKKRRIVVPVADFVPTDKLSIERLIEWCEHKGSARHRVIAVHLRTLHDIVAVTFAGTLRKVEIDSRRKKR